MGKELQFRRRITGQRQENIENNTTKKEMRNNKSIPA
jgi:hypothetical protein